MSFSFRPAIRENVGLIIGLFGSSGSGKTMTAMRLAKGICGDDPFAVIDTENGRAKHYADFFKFDHGDLQPPFTPMAYLEAMQEADRAGYRAILVDSMSHEHDGEGGLLDEVESYLDRVAKDDWKKREACTMAAWAHAKRPHKKMLGGMLRLKINTQLIICCRADQKIRMEKDANNKTVIVDAGFVPVCEKRLPYEMTASFLLSSDNPGVPNHPLKLQKQHRAMFLRKDGEGNLLPIDESCGQEIDKWARGAPRQPAAPKQQKATL